MIFILLLIGIIIVATGYKGTQGDLFKELVTDVPAFGTWAAAIVALGIVGFIPGLKPVSRGLLGLVILVIILNNYEKIITGFDGTFKATSPSSSTSSNTVNPASLSSSPSSFSATAIQPQSLANTVASATSTLGLAP